MAIAAFAFAACGKEEAHYVRNIGDGDNTPSMLTRDVATYISDSGYTKYKITTPLWAMYEESKEPFWRFPEGIELEQYDRQLQPQARMRCDSAHYLSQRRIWRLDGHVVMVNTQHDTFMTEQVYWDQSMRKVYSDSFIHIVRSDRVIEGYGFESDEQMTAYTVNLPTAIFPVSRPARDTLPTQ